MYFYSPHQPQLLTTFSYNLHLALPNQWRTKKINFRSTDPPFMTYVRAEVASVFEWLRRSIRWMVRMNKNSVGPQQRVEMRVLPYGGGSLCFSLLWLDRILEPKHLLDTCRKDETKERRRSFDVFLWTKLVGKLRKIDEARLRSTSTHPSPGEGCVDVREERIGWIFLSFPNSNIKKKLDILGLSSLSYNFFNGATCCVHSGHHCAKTSLVVTYGPFWHLRWSGGDEVGATGGHVDQQLEDDDGHYVDFQWAEKSDKCPYWMSFIWWFLLVNLFLVSISVNFICSGS